ncbi:MAG: hypothetical protein ABL999_10780 [Pyrinomonadaceae bacterium]
MQTIEIPVNEYKSLQEELTLLKDNALLENVNRLIDILYQDKYGLYMGDYTGDLTEGVMDEAWEESASEWN